MPDATEFAHIPPTTLADILGREQVMDIGVRPLWDPTPRVAGPAFTVRCSAGDNLMLHAAIHRAPPGSVLVVQAGDVDYAVAGGNVCAVAHRRGIAAFVVDGVIRDLGEVRAMGFPVFARGVIPIPGRKRAVDPLNVPVRCGGVTDPRRKGLRRVRAPTHAAARPPRALGEVSDNSLDGEPSRPAWGGHLDGVTRGAVQEGPRDR
jgi:4-hydroxy-4-methyl-2-oxoglutarate aldolase